MKKYRTRFGTWFAILCAKEGLNVAGASIELGLSPVTMSLIIAGQHPLPVFLRENIITTFHLSESEIEELDKSIVETENEAVAIERNYKKVVVAQTVNQQPWTRDLMDAMAKNVNALSPDAVNQIMQILGSVEKSSEGMSAEISKDVDIKVLSKDLNRRYKKNPEKADQILSYIIETRG